MRERPHWPERPSRTRARLVRRPVQSRPDVCDNARLFRFYSVPRAAPGGGKEAVFPAESCVHVVPAAGGRAEDRTGQERPLASGLQGAQVGPPEWGEVAAWLLPGCGSPGTLLEGNWGALLPNNGVDALDARQSPTLSTKFPREKLRRFMRQALRRATQHPKPALPSACSLGCLKAEAEA